MGNRAHHWLPASGDEVVSLRVRDGAILSVCPATSAGDYGKQSICVLEHQWVQYTIPAKEVTLAFNVAVAIPGPHRYEDAAFVGVALGRRQVLFEVLLDLRELTDLAIREEADFVKVNFALGGEQFTVFLRSH